MSASRQGWIRVGGLHASLLCLAVVASLGAASLSTAGTMTPPQGDVVVTINGVNPGNQVGRTVEYRAPVQSDGSFDLKGQPSPGEGWSLTKLEVSGNVDPFTNLNFAVTNNAAVTLAFTVSVTLPVTPLGPATLHGGSMGGTLTDANFNGVATVKTLTGVPLYRGQIDGVTALSMFPDVYSASASVAGESVAVGPLNLGLPGTIPSGPALSTIGIINQFTLTAGDTFSGSSFFVVQAVPEPSTAALLGAAFSLTALAGRTNARGNLRRSSRSR